MSSGKLGQGARTKNALRLEVGNSLQKVNRDNKCSLKKVNKARSKLIRSCDRCEMRLSEVFLKLEAIDNQSNNRDSKCNLKEPHKESPAQGSVKTNDKHLGILNDPFYSTQAPQPQNQLAPRRY